MIKSRHGGTDCDGALGRGYGLGFVAGRRKGLKEARDWFWCGFCAALATWPLAGIAWVAWRVFWS